MMALAFRYIESAKVAIRQARQTLDEGHIGLSIKRDQEATEYALKAILHAVGQAPKQDHDISSVLIQCAASGRFPSWFQQEAPRFGLMSVMLLRVRSYSSYGEELLNIDADAIFSGRDAVYFLESAEEVVRACERLFAELNPP